MDFTQCQYKNFTVLGRWYGPRPKELKACSSTLWECRCACGKTFVSHYLVLKRPRALNRCKCSLGRAYRAAINHHTGPKSLVMTYQSTKQMATQRQEGFEWLTLEDFLATVTPRPTPKHWLTRKDPRRAWGPTNWRWAHRDGVKRKNMVKVSFEGQTRTLETWATLLGIKYQTLYGRLYVRCWSIAKAFRTPVKGRALNKITTKSKRLKDV